MNAQAMFRMSADEFVSWAANRPDARRFELVAGEVVAMSPERAGHVRIKHLVWLALREAVGHAGPGIEVMGDGMAVRIDDRTVYEPDALVRIGPRLPDDALTVDDPLVAVEILSPSTEARDSGAKLHGYVRVPTLRHYLIVDGAAATVIHHHRMTDGRIETRILNSGNLLLEPPGISVQIESFFADPLLG